MDELEDILKQYLILTIERGEEDKLTIKDVNSIQIQIDLEEHLFISSNITDKISPNTLKTLFDIYREWSKNL